MSLEEKIGQLLTLEGWQLYTKTGGQAALNESVKEVIGQRKAGAIYGVFRADPWTQITLSTGLQPLQSAEIANALQAYAISNSRLPIPLLLVEECPHGHMAIGGTVFPAGLGQASTFDPALIGRMARASATETRASGGNVCYGPVIDIARDLRWSRVEEGFGEDPFLTSSMAAAAVRGLQGASLSNPDSVAATLEHFAGAGEPEGGHNLGPVHAGVRELNEVLLPAFKAGVAAGARSITSSYNAIDGVPSTANRWLLTDLLRGQWGFQGFVASDLGGIDRLVDAQHVAANLEGAASLAINAGVDSDLGGKAFAQLAVAVNSGAVSAQVLDRAVGRILTVKFDLGLFENPYVKPENARHVIGSQEHQRLARQVARESIILLKNADHTLPLRRDLSSIAVVGPNADNIYNQLGDYTAPQPEGKVVTVLAGIREALGSHALVRYARGRGIRSLSTAGFGEALDAIRKSQVAIVVLGGSSARNFRTAFDSSGAAVPSLSADGSEMESGEGTDRASLDLAGVQDELLKRIVELDKPVILVMIEGRPLNISRAAEHVPAILEAFYPGEQGGAAIADVLFGNYNPAGRLPLSVPRSVGQLPIFYGVERPEYVDLPAAPIFPFGYGLSYTSFSYRNLETRVNAADPAVDVSVEIENTGTMSGDEVAQLYLHERVTSVERPLKSLRGFQRIHLDAGAKQTVHFHLAAPDLAVFNQDLKWIVEAGTFDVMVGASSADIRQTGQFVIPHSTFVDPYAGMAP
jgi:beta-glucosidase